MVTIGAWQMKKQARAAMRHFKSYILTAIITAIVTAITPTFIASATASEQIDHLEPIDGQNEEGGSSTGGVKNHKWSYQPEETQAGKYYQPAYTATLPLQVERNKMRIDALEDRVETLEKALTSAINTINAQSAIIKKMNQ